MRNLQRSPWAWLLLGAVLVLLSQSRFGLGVLAWLAPVPWLHFLRLTRGRAARLALAGTSVAVWILVLFKLLTAPMPPALAFGFGPPLGLVLVLPYLGWDALRRRLGETVGSVLFAALLVVAEWSLHGLLPLGTWGSLANTQVDRLDLLQLASITGLHGISFLMALVASVAERALSGERRGLLRPAMATLAAVLVVLAFGQARLALASGRGLPTRRVAAVGTDSLVGTSPNLPGPARLHEVEQGLVRRTELAAASGATLVVWNEAATMVRPAHEAAFVGRLRALSKRLGIDLVAGYVVPLSERPLRYENKYVFLRPDGSVHHRYFKHEPVPGEPASPGTGPMQRVGTPGQGSVSGAICYDYDFPYLGRAHARLDTDIVALPSSDWRGIDPLHTQMAAVRAIEGGHSVVRSTRFGLSAAIDPWGRMRASSSHFDGPLRVLVAEVPRAGLRTFYGQLGDWFPASCALFALGALGWCLRARRHRQRPEVVDSGHDGHGTVGGVPGGASSL